ncbi:IS110 family transposase [Streptomyces atratus]|uniref:IS110 family transposase n=1 Tax=Streptomyces atratus TaxID=1893 RepID=UPI0036AEF928
MTHNAAEITGGVDTHGLTHHSAVIDPVGRHLADREFPTTIRGYRELLDWMRSHGKLIAVGVEGTGAYGAELARVLTAAGIAVIDRPDRKTRRMKGKSDPIDAYAAATAVLSGRATGTPKSRDGVVEAVRVLRVARRSAVKARTQAMNQIRGLLVSAPAMLRERTTGMDRAALIRALARLWPGDDLSRPLAATRAALRRLARRHQAMDEEIAELDAELGPLTRQAAPVLLELYGVGPETAGQLLASAGDNPERMRSEAAFAHLAAVAPIPASSGRTHRHRLNRGGEQRPAHHRPGAHALRRTHPSLRRAAHQGRTLEAGHHALPQAIRRPRGLPRSHQHTSGPNRPNRPCSCRLTSIGASPALNLRVLVPDAEVPGLTADPESRLCGLARPTHRSALLADATA